MKKYQIEISEDQLKIITEALDQYARLCCFQFDELSLWIRCRQSLEKYQNVLNIDKFEQFKKEISDVKFKYLGNWGASWNASEFVEHSLHIRDSLTPVLCIEKKKSDKNHSCIQCEGSFSNNKFNNILIKPTN